MDELPADDQRRLLGELKLLREFLDEPPDASPQPQATPSPFTTPAQQTAPQAQAPTLALVTPNPQAPVAGSLSTMLTELPVANEPPLLDDVVEDGFRVDDVEPNHSLAQGALADLDFGDESDWTQFVDQVFAQSSGISLGLDSPGSTRGRPADEDVLLAEMTRLLDERLTTLRATLVAEMRAMLARRRIG